MRLSVGACESVSVSNSKRAFHSCLTEISATDEEDRLSLYFLQVTSTHDPNNRPTVHADSLPMPAGWNMSVLEEPMIKHNQNGAVSDGLLYYNAWQ